MCTPNIACTLSTESVHRGEGGGAAGEQAQVRQAVENERGAGGGADAVEIRESWWLRAPVGHLADKRSGRIQHGQNQAGNRRSGGFCCG